MDFEPQKFFVGLVDFFSILMPGVVLTYLLKDTAGPWVLGTEYFSLHGAEAWVVLLFSSYLLGHFLFLIASLLDDYLYDPVRRCTGKEQITRILTGRGLSPKPLRWLALACFKKRPDAAVDQAIRIKDSYLKGIEAKGSVNAFQWCKARLALQHPEALAAVNRFEADSKFFRSFVPVLIILMAIDWYKRKFGLAAVSLVLLVLALWRYMEQRFKSTQQAYWMILTLESDKQPPPAVPKPAELPASTPDSAPLTHAGGVVFKKKRSGELEYLLVEAADSRQWVLPKGHIERGEDPKRTAIREVREETGVWARIVGELETVEYPLKNETVRVRFYLMQALDEGKPEDRLRERKSCLLDEALERASHPETRKLLELANNRRA